jgi:hypothetical protein
MNQVEKLRHISAQEFVHLGMQDLAYIKEVEVSGEHGFAIHAADGTQMAVIRDRDVAVAAVRQHDLEPLSVH